MTPSVDLPTTNDYQSLIRDSTPIIDVRSESEFERGAIHSAINIPILTDEERKVVGITYKNFGADDALCTGLNIVKGDIKNQRLNAWLSLLNEHPTAVLCCWRGGLRSEIAQEWLAERGRDVARIKGGSKNLRRFCLDFLDQSQKRNFLVLAGRTGSGKTQIIQDRSPAIDLEGIANHRGSAFGGLNSPQPTPVQFDFMLAHSLLNTPCDKFTLIEDESAMIGVRHLPTSLIAAMSRAPVVVVDVPLADRVELIFDSYVAGSSGVRLRANLGKIVKRLGTERYQEILARLDRAIETSDKQDHFRWIELLLSYYYDRMYDFQLNAKQDRIIFQGTRFRVLDFLESRYNICATAD